MTVLRFITTTLITAALGFGVIAAVVQGGESKPAPRDSIVLPSPSQGLDLSQAQPLQDGHGVADIEAEQALWVVQLAQQDMNRGQEALVELLVHGQTTTGRQVALEGLVASDTQHWPSDYRGEFLRTLAPGALEAALVYGVPASVTMAQAIQESGWGRSVLAKQHHNLFGVKAGSAQNGVLFRTDEVVDGHRHQIQAQFLSFSHPGDAIQHHGELLSQDARYAAALANGAHWRAFLSEMAPVYASDPAYAQRVSWLIERYDLDRWDRLVNEVIGHAA